MRTTGRRRAVGKPSVADETATVITEANLQRVILSMLAKLDLVELGEVYGMVRARATYRNRECPQLLCSFCHLPFRGPAVYCSLRCATAAA